MPNPGPIDQKRELLAKLKQQTRESQRDPSVPDQAARHISGPTHKLASAVAQHQVSDDIPRTAREKAEAVGTGRGSLDERAIRDSLAARADARAPPEGRNMEAESEAARLQSAREHYEMALKEKQ